MENKRYKPIKRTMYYLIRVPLLVAMAVATAISSTEPIALLIMLPTDALVVYFLLSELMAYAELQDEGVFIRFGFFAKQFIPYDSVYGCEKVEKWYADSTNTFAIKTAVEHINLKYDKWRTLSLSIEDADGFMMALETKRGGL